MTIYLEKFISSKLKHVKSFDKSHNNYNRKFMKIVVERPVKMFYLIPKYVYLQTGPLALNI